MSDLPFQRIVVRFRWGNQPFELPSRFIVELARTWRLELVGTFAPEPNLSQVAKHPAAREFRLHERKWGAVENGAIMSQLSSVTRECERRFTNALQSARVQGQFASEISEAAEDLLAVCEPDNPLDQLGQSFGDEIERVLAAGNAMLVVPRRVARNRGSIVTISKEHDRQLSAMGAKLASTLDERLYGIELKSADDFKSLPARLASLNTRFLVVSREILDNRVERLLLLARTCLAPLLIPAGEAKIGKQFKTS